jgi:hypothetical protein
MSVMSQRSVASALLLLLLLSGCGASSDFMTSAKALPDTAPAAGEATIVFVRPSDFASAMVMTIMDDQGRFLGDSTASSCFRSQLAAGGHLLIGWAENTAALQADLAADQLYYVEVSARPGFWSSQVQLFAVTPSSPQWSELPGWLAHCEPLIPDEAAGQADLDHRYQAVSERVRRAQEAIHKYTAEALAERTLRPSDGVAPQAPLPPPRPPQAAPPSPLSAP